MEVRALNCVVLWTGKCATKRRRGAVGTNEKGVAIAKNAGWTLDCQQR